MSEFDMKPQDVARRLSTDERLNRVGQVTGFTARQASAITKARLHLALAELAEGNVANVQKWLDEVGTRAPAEAIRLYMELMEFSTPRMKAAQVNVNADVSPAAGGRQMKDMSIEELQNVVAEQG